VKPLRLDLQLLLPQVLRLLLVPVLLWLLQLQVLPPVPLPVLLLLLLIQLCCLQDFQLHIHLQVLELHRRHCRKFQAMFLLL
jgi:hypothetical protein